MATIKKPRLMVLSLGGTWSARRDSNGTIVPGGPLGWFRPADLFTRAKVEDQLTDSRWSLPKEPLLFEEQLDRLCDPSGFGLLNIDSTDMAPVHWTQTAEFILQHGNDYDAWVVATGTDTMSSLAAALAFSLRRFGKPVVVTGAQKSRLVAGSDALFNLMNAMRVAAHLTTNDRGDVEPTLREVVVTFGSRIIRATRCRKFSEADLEAFATINAKDLGRIRLDVDIDKTMRLDVPEKGTKYWPKIGNPTKYDSQIGLLHLYPEMPESLLLTLGESCKAVVLAGFGAGNAPTRDAVSPVAPTIRTLTELGVPVLMTTQCVLGSAEFKRNRYKGSEEAQAGGCIILNDMLPDVAAVKARFVISNDFGCLNADGRVDRNRFHTLMIRPLAGEMTKNKE